MKLKVLLGNLELLETQGSVEAEVGGIHSDSRRVRQGDLFVAVRGEKLDGHEFIGDAVEAGASVVVCERILGAFPGVTQVRVADARRALAQLAGRFHGAPSEGMRVIGITGTNGKTTTSWLLASILEAVGMPTGVVGTIAYRIGSRELPAPNTTPPADDLQELLAQMLHSGMKAVVMEVSSHSLVQRRVDGVAWDAGIFTNLTQDHLDYHGDMGAYFEAKKLLFQQLGGGCKTRCAAILNADDPKSELLSGVIRAGVRVVRYGAHPSAEVRAEAVEHSVAGSRFTLVAGGQRIDIATPLCGAHNILNCLAAAAAAVALDLDLPAIKRGIESLRSVPGRLERLTVAPGAGDFAIFIDYAHTDDALRKVLTTLRPLTRGRLISVFGCGGNRDTTKRPLMGRVASELSHYSVLTTDNPRHEEPSAILQQIAAGFEARDNYEIVPDRRAAIRAALVMARDGDVILIAGKGHETYQEVAGTRSPFDDRKVALDLLEELRGGAGGKEGAWKN